jgi:hypothetical protein
MQLMSDFQDPTLAQAEADLRKAEEAIERATKDRDEILAFIRRHKMYASASPLQKSLQKSVKDETMAESIEAVLGAATAPMLVPDIVAALKARGRKFTSADPAGHVSTTMSRNERFSYEKGIGWSLTET